jgi:hypothetical protein
MSSNWSGILIFRTGGHLFLFVKPLHNGFAIFYLDIFKTAFRVLQCLQM